MKFLLVLLLLALGVVLYFVFGPGGNDTNAAHDATQAQQAASHHPKSHTSLKEDVNSVVNYGIGATQLKAKKHMSNKIDKINKGHNKELNEKLDK